MSAESRLAELKLELPRSPSRPASTSRWSSSATWPTSRGTARSKRQDDAHRPHRRRRRPQAGVQSARQTGLAILATLRETLGSLDHVVRVVKVLGMVNCTPDFTQHPQVINGCSELFRDIWGEDQASAPAAPSAWARCPATSPPRSKPFSRSSDVVAKSARSAEVLSTTASDNHRSPPSLRRPARCAFRSAPTAALPFPTPPW